MPERILKNKENRFISDARSLGRWLKKIDVPAGEIQLGDIVCDGIGSPYFVARIVDYEDNDTCIGIYDMDNNGGGYLKDDLIRILPRDIIADRSYD